MKFSRLFSALALLISSYSLQTKAMKRTLFNGETGSATQSTHILDSEADQVESDQTEHMIPIGIIINHVGVDNGSMLSNLTLLLNAQFFIDITRRPTIMISPVIIKSFLAAKKKNDLNPYNGFGTNKSLVYSQDFDAKKEHYTEDNGEKYSYDCYNYFHKVLDRVIFLDDLTTHFVFIFPDVAEDSLTSFKTFRCRNQDDLSEFIEKKQNISPSLHDFEIITEFCNSFEYKFKIVVAGHGDTNIEESKCYLCNLSPTLCVSMLESFNESNIKQVTLISCCIGGNNSYYLKPKKTEFQEEPSYTFTLAIQGISDNPGPDFDTIKNFLNTDTQIDSSALKIADQLISKKWIDQNEAKAIIQVMPEGKVSFEIYENDKIVVIDDKATEEKVHNISAQMILLKHDHIKTPLEIVSKENINIYCIKPRIHNYTVESICLKGIGLLNFLEHSFTHTAAPQFPKQIRLKKLCGEQDFCINSKENIQMHKDNPESIILSDVDIYARGTSSIEYSFTLNGKIYSNKNKL